MSELSQIESRATSEDDFHLMDRYWRAANYLSVGRIYMLDIPLLREPLRREHVKARLLGHWGTTAGLNFVYARANARVTPRARPVLDANTKPRGARPQ